MLSVPSAGVPGADGREEKLLLSVGEERTAGYIYFRVSLALIKNTQLAIQPKFIDLFRSCKTTI